MESDLDSNYEPSDEDASDDELDFDDRAECETPVNVTNLENPTIVIGIRFEDGLCFKRAIRQHVVLKSLKL